MSIQTSLSSFLAGEMAEVAHCHPSYMPVLYWMMYSPSPTQHPIMSADLDIDDHKINIPSFRIVKV